MMTPANWLRVGLLILAFALGAILIQRCVPAPSAVPQKEQIVYRPAYVAVHDTIAKVELVDRIVVRHVFAPTVKPDADGKTKYRLQRSDLVVVAKSDSTGLQLDNLAFTNRQSLLIGVDKKGNGMAQVINSSPYVKTDSVNGYHFKVKQLPRVTYGISAGVFLTPVGPQVGVGVGFHLSLNKRK